MSEFSQMLSKFIKERDTNIYMLAKYCNYDRANMYKLTSGKRNAPDLPFVKKLAEYMHTLQCVPNGCSCPDRKKWIRIP